MNVLFLSPSYPREMPHFTRGLAEVGVRVWGVGDQPAHALPEEVRRYLSDYLQVPRLLDEDDLVERTLRWLRGRSVDHVESLWEPLMVAAARIRQQIQLPGMTPEHVTDFRDKQRMKERVASVGIRVPYAFRARSISEIREAVEKIGYPLILKPIAGAGSADTYRINSPQELEQILPRLQHVPELSCEEFIDGREFTFDALCLEGRPLFVSVTEYLPRPLIMRTNEWISPVQITIRDLQQPHLAPGLQMGHEVLEAMQMQTGFVHMEWYLTSKGEAVFGEIACRPGGAYIVDQMNFSNDIDLFREWARVRCHQTFHSPTARPYNVAAIFKRAQGQGHIRSIHGLQHFREQCGRWLCAEHLLPIGALRRDWKQTLLSDGVLIVRHPDWDTTVQMARMAATQIQLFAA
ncbi:ATP-grasp domain-containing protein [Myxococcota bacterium]|nr:ATP-grasp domain-containing protein [Myxococcota bacterium]